MSYALVLSEFVTREAYDEMRKQVRPCADVALYTRGADDACAAWFEATRHLLSHVPESALFEAVEGWLREAGIPKRIVRDDLLADPSMLLATLAEEYALERL